MLKCRVTLSNNSKKLEQVVKLREPAREKFRPDSLLVCYTIFRTDSKLQPVRGVTQTARLQGCAGHHQPLQPTRVSPSTFQPTPKSGPSRGSSVSLKLLAHLKPHGLKPAIKVAEFARHNESRAAIDSIINQISACQVGSFDSL